jgi:hypothetical protein
MPDPKFLYLVWSPSRSAYFGVACRVASATCATTTITTTTTTEQAALRASRCAKLCEALQYIIHAPGASCNRKGINQMHIKRIECNGEITTTPKRYLIEFRCWRRGLQQGSPAETWWNHMPSHQAKQCFNLLGMCSSNLVVFVDICAGAPSFPMPYVTGEVQCDADFWAADRNGHGS